MNIRWYREIDNSRPIEGREFFYFIGNSYKVKNKDVQLAVMCFAVNGTARARRMRKSAFFVLE